jgi:hypothetical protein
MMRYVIIQVRQRAERAFARYAELHRAILDPKVAGNISMHTDKQLETISREREIQRERETHTHRERETETETETERERDREIVLYAYALTAIPQPAPIIFEYYIWQDV